MNKEIIKINKEDKIIQEILALYEYRRSQEMN